MRVRVGVGKYKVGRDLAERREAHPALQNAGTGRHKYIACMHALTMSCAMARASCSAVAAMCAAVGVICVM